MKLDSFQTFIKIKGTVCVIQNFENPFPIFKKHLSIDSFKLFFDYEILHIFLKHIKNFILLLYILNNI